MGGALVDGVFGRARRAAAARPLAARFFAFARLTPTTKQKQKQQKTAYSYEKRHSNLSAHCSPAFRVREGDTVVVGQCRPLSKTVRFNVLRVVPASAADKKKGFSGF